MNFFAAKDISKYYGERLLFEGLSFGISKGEKVALIADNGTGKSTLLKMLAALEEPDTGEITRMTDLRIGYLAQDPDFEKSWTIQELISTAHTHKLEIIDRYHQMLQKQADDPTAVSANEFAQVSAEMDVINGWDYERQQQIIFSKFNFFDLSRKIDSLSGGEQKRLALALVLLDNPDLLVLDEPTNHLDIEMIEWLEAYLSPSTTTLLVVSHDRYFLDNVCNHIWEMSDGKIFHHKGNYAYYLEKKAERIAIENVELDKAKKLFRKELEWMRRSPQARTTKAKSRINDFYDIKDKAHAGKTKQELQLDIKMERLGGKIIELHNIYKNYGEKPIISDFTYTFKRGDRVGIVGPNGAGKSTLLKILADEEKIDRGKIKRGQTLKIGHYRQDGIQLKPQQRVIDALKEIAEVIVLSSGRKLSAAQMLEYFQFTPHMQFTHVSKLSGGERRRLYLLTVLMANPNFLILDEPTNDLDLGTLNKLEEFLTTYPGCVVMVSHDRYFMDNLVDHLFIFQGEGKIKGYNGTYTEYRLSQASQPTEGKKVKSTAAQDYDSIKSAKRKQQQWQRKVMNLEKEIQSLEKKKLEIEGRLTSADLALEDITKLSNEVGAILQKIEAKTEEWFELSEQSE
ncbi:MAG: ABC-F family ATP-binding cassette domain-containing protein [Saprospiraceae bacterium]|nr:ABC-F family ATP-binding cassette domain-containing protein [Saprospiraceae bacterium]